MHWKAPGCAIRETSFRGGGGQRSVAERSRIRGGRVIGFLGIVQPPSVSLHNGRRFHLFSLKGLNCGPFEPTRPWIGQSSGNCYEPVITLISRLPARRAVSPAEPEAKGSGWLEVFFCHDRESRGIPVSA